MYKLDKPEKMDINLRRCRPQDLLRMANYNDHRRVGTASILHAKVLQFERSSQIAFACSKSTIETLEKDVKYVHS